MGIESRTPLESERQLLRHTLATLAYRGGKTLHGAPEGFSGFRASETTRIPGQILSTIAEASTSHECAGAGAKKEQGALQHSRALPAVPPHYSGHSFC